MSRALTLTAEEAALADRITRHSVDLFLSGASRSLVLEALDLAASARQAFLYPLRPEQLARIEELCR